MRIHPSLRALSFLLALALPAAAQAAPDSAHKAKAAKPVIVSPAEAKAAADRNFKAAYDTLRADIFAHAAPATVRADHDRIRAAKIAKDHADAKALASHVVTIDKKNFPAAGKTASR